MMEGEPDWTVRVEVSRGNAVQTFDRLASELAGRGLNRRQLFWSRLAVEEALVNALAVRDHAAIEIMRRASFLEVMCDGELSSRYEH